MNLDEILGKISEADLISYYFGVTEIPCKIQAPYRKDNKPSVGIYIGKNGKIQYWDFATRDSGGVLDLLERTWCLDFKHTIERVIKDLPRLSGKAEIRQTSGNTNTSIHKHSNSVIQVKFREWRKYDLEYWESFGISKPWLEFGDVHPISHIFYTNEEGTKCFPAEKYAYAYIERKDGIVTMKIYQPFSITKKWINKHDSSVWDLWTKLPKSGETLIITSSRKDALCIWENTGIPSISMQGEGYIPKEHIIQELKDRFTNIYILYDNDFKAEENHGRKFAKDLSERFGLRQIEIPDSFKCKDTSDLCKTYGRETVNKVIYALITPKPNLVEIEDDLPF